MPIWGQIILGIAAVVGAITYLWQKVLRPGARLITTMDLLLPVARELATQFHDVPEALETLRDMAIEFHPDSGTTLRDVVNRLEVAVHENRMAAEVLKVNVEAARQLAAEDRQQLAKLIVKLDQVNAGIVDAANGAAAVAVDLEATHTRAEAEPLGSDPGAAADAAMRRNPDEEG